jgi:two-component system response regulator HydG
MNGTILVVDDDQSMCELVHDALSKHGHDVAFTTSGEQAILMAAERDYDLVLTDLRLAGESGLHVCDRIVANHPNTPVVVMTAFGSMDTAISAIRAGAYDFVNKPLDMKQLGLIVQRAIRYRALEVEVVRLSDEVARSRPIEEMIGTSPVMKRVYEIIHQVADTDATVVITGESGTGKELVARSIHKRSKRPGRLVSINCAAMPANLLESELFGHVKGAFTDAKSSHDGLFVDANDGTLFLDEIGEMPLEMQSSLLRALQERRVRPVGGSREVSFDTRIVAATNKDLESAIEDGSFREDLYYRLNVVRIAVPPLRSRGQDILLLAQHFIQTIAKRSGKAVKGLSAPAAHKLLEYDWPGNVRELENSMERAIALTRFEEIVIGDFPDKLKDYESDKFVIRGDDPEELPTLDEVEARYIRRVIKAVGGNKTQAARVLGLDRRTLYRRLERLDIEC